MEKKKSLCSQQEHTVRIKCNMERQSEHIHSTYIQERSIPMKQSPEVCTDCGVWRSSEYNKMLCIKRGYIDTESNCNLVQYYVTFFFFYKLGRLASIYFIKHYDKSFFFSFYILSSHIIILTNLHVFCLYQTLVGGCLLCL